MRTELHESPLVIVVRPGRQTGTILAWLRQLVPAALLIVAAASPPSAPAADTITVDVDDVASSPLSLADALARARQPAPKVRGS
jgi:hypothetical protein